MILLQRTIAFLIVGTSLISAGCTSTTEAAPSAEAQAPVQSPAQAPTQSPAQSPPLREPDVVYVPTPPQVVEQMLAIANVNQDDVLYDLGSGDGRIPIAAVRERGVQRATGIDINPQRIQEANDNAQQAGVSDRVRFLNQDLFESDFSEATVVTLYLLPSLNVKLRPQLFSQLQPGTRIVSHDFDMGEWQPEQTVEVNVNGRTHTVYFWTVPENPPENLRS
jgi:protein-L-isoaspartate O-methyltransferase